ncbi:NAD/NADP octopine/nopaline dehydrogenase family protein [Amycolatopsis jejuensis]|uniref:NAD/NADP octopine/nopaline dehydrogenase family protein n=1 Tax=Amycolatopsis jejuensis TaxID=330084 RepID=UPI0005264F45|nr:NAD/NADP octopine/nopaline dehydrogenase family protein [Amycolatopsis jejuensis]
MTAVAVLGAGGGGLAATVELIAAGHEVRLWNRSTATLARSVRDGVVRYRGLLGEGEVRPSAVTGDLAAALNGADVTVVCLPSVVHGALFGDLARLGGVGTLVLNPGHTGGALHARAVFAAHGVKPPRLAEFSTLTYVARVRDGVLDVSGRAGRVWAGCLPGGEAALDWALRLFPGASAAPDVLFSSLADVNLVLHPPGAVLGLSWVEATGGGFPFYVDGVTPGVARVIDELDRERLAVAKAFGHEMPSLLEEMTAIGTVDAEAARAGDTMAAIRGGVANQRIAAPDSLRHRYYAEDLPFGVQPLVSLAEVAGVPTPIAGSLLALGSAAAGLGPGLDAQRLGIAGLDLAGVLDLVRGRES